MRRLHYTYVALHGQAYRNDDVCRRVERSAFLHCPHFLTFLSLHLHNLLHVYHLHGQI